MSKRKKMNYAYFLNLFWKFIFRQKDDVINNNNNNNNNNNTQTLVKSHQLTLV